MVILTFLSHFPCQNFGLYLYLSSPFFPHPQAIQGRKSIIPQNLFLYNQGQVSKKTHYANAPSILNKYSHKIVYLMRI
jgi:hypothetical protein